MENVVQFPDELGCLARDALSGVAMINAADTGIERAREQRIEGALKLSAAFYAARQKFKDNIGFSQWCHDNNLGDNVVNYNDRAAFVEFGSNPVRARAVLTSTKRISWREIHRLEWSSSQPVKTTASTTPKRQAAAASIRAYTAVHGVTPTVQQAVKASGLSRIVIEPALATVKAEDNLNPPPSSPTKTANAHHEAILKIRLQELEKTFEERVQTEYRKRVAEMFPDLKQRYDDTARKEKIYMDQLSKRAVFTKAEYVDLLFCVRNEHVPQERRDRATIALEAQKLKLVGA